MKNKILTLLKQNTGYLSGEEISAALGISRTAVWKHINSLRDQGYGIESQTKLGYCLTHIPDRIYGQEVAAFLHTKSLGREFFCFFQVDSTNLEARRLAEKGALHGTVVAAESQTAGKGRLGRQWYSPSTAGIWMTAILRPGIPPQDAPKITLTAAVAVTEGIFEVCGIMPGIKWPNDILINGKKVCGILTEMRADMDRIHYVLLGIGINVNVNETHFPDDIVASAASLKTILGESLNRTELTAAVLNRLEIYYDALLSGDFDSIRKKWKNYSVNIGRRITVNTVGKTVEGMAVDIDENGLLLLKGDDGEINRIVAGDVTLKGH